MHSNDYATAQSLISVAVSSLGATQLHFLEPGVKVNGDYYRNTVLLNMLLPDICSVFRDYYLFQQDGARHIVHVTLLPCCREMPEFIPPEMWPPNSPDLNPVDYSIWGMLQERVYRYRIHDVKELKEHLLREWRLLDDTIIAVAIVQWRSRSFECMCLHEWWTF